MRGAAVHEDELLSEIDTSVASLRRTLSDGVLDDYADIVSTRVARMVADWYMYDPELVMTESFREAVLDRLAQGYQ